MIEIYELVDPVTLAIRYVGQSRNARRRLQWNFWAAGAGRHGRIYNWLRLLRRANRRPVLRIIERCALADADQREIYWIAVRRAEGFELVNCTDGGGGLRGRRHTAETRDRIRTSLKGRKRSPESCARISIARRSWQLTAEHKAKLVAALRRRKFTAEQRHAIAKRMKGNRYGSLIRRDEGWSAKVSRSLSGEKAAGAKLTDAQAAEVRRLHASGVRQFVIARGFGLSPVDVHRIVRFKTYKYSI